MNKPKLRSVMVLNGDKQADLAEALSIPESGVSARLDGKVDFRASEICKIVERYHLSAEETFDIFFKEVAS